MIYEYDIPEDQGQELSLLFSEIFQLNAKFLLKLAQNNIGLRQNFKGLFGFRGMYDSTWPLQTTLERVLKTTEDKWFGLEKEYYKNWLKRFHEYKFQIDLPECIEILQHFSGYTRLLDFSYDFRYAMFFSNLHNPNINAPRGSLWIIPIPQFMMNNLSNLPNLNMKKLKPSLDNNFYCDEIKDLFKKSPIKLKKRQKTLLYQDYGTTNNPRIQVQQGFFIAGNGISPKICDYFDNNTKTSKNFNEFQDLINQHDFSEFNTPKEFKEKYSKNNTDFYKINFTRKHSQYFIDEGKKQGIDFQNIFPKGNFPDDLLDLKILKKI